MNIKDYDMELMKVPKRERISLRTLIDKLNEAIDNDILSDDLEIEYVSIDSLGDMIQIELADWYEEPPRRETLRIRKNVNVERENMVDEVFTKYFGENYGFYDCSINYLMAWLKDNDGNIFRVEYEDNIFEKDLHEEIIL